MNFVQIDPNDGLESWQLTPRGNVRFLTFLWVLLALVGCQGKPDAPESGVGGQGVADSAADASSGTHVLVEGGLESVPLSRFGNGVGKFVELSAGQTGLDFSNELRPENMRKYLLNGAGLATGDFDNDGRVDVFAVSQDGSNRLFRQAGPWKFEDVTAQAGDLSGGDQWGTGASFGDLNNDGWLDLYVCNINGPNQLFINQKNGTFAEEAEKRGAALNDATTMASMADFDNDGDLDIYLVNNRLFSILEESPEAEIRMVNGVPQVHPDYRDQYFLLDGKVQEAGQRDRLLRNDGSGNFVDVTDAAGIAGYDMGLSATWWDFDGDGWMDLYVANDLKSPDHLYHNLGNGTFQDVLPDAVGHTPWFSMGADAADINNDGRMDLLVADMSSTTHYKQKTTMGEMGSSAWFLTMGKPRQFMRNALFVNSGGERFYEAANLSGLDSTDWSWAIKFGDFDSDSLVDVFITNGVGRNMNDSDLANEYKKLVAEGKHEEARQQLLKMPPLNEENLAFRNRGDLRFENAAAAWGVNHLGVSQGASVADIDRDGDLDLIVSNMNEPLGVYRNEIGNGNNMLVRLVGTQSNRFGVDARISLRCGDIRQTRTMGLARGFMSADEPIAHFGLGDAATVDEVLVEWPSGLCQRFENLEPNRFLTITEGSSGMCDRPSRPVPQAWFQPVAAASSGLDARHTEIEVDDYLYQPLLPNKLTQLGPGIAWGDVNGDGRQDCFVGNGSGAPPQLLMQQDDGTFRSGNPWYDDAGYEDTGAVFFDVDSDGDLDLYVCSAGYEQAADSRYLRDRLYLNDGHGAFSRAPDEMTPETLRSSSCVSACDFDHDGDLDLFVGTRVLPRQWPLNASSALLENRNGRLIDVTSERASGLIDCGLATGSVWTDIDNDGWMDLIIAFEWGPVRCYRNDAGQLLDITDTAGLSPYRGWWNSVAAGDIDNDGDMDLIAMNAGLNTKYHCSPDHPVQLFVGDFDNSGTLDIVEAEWEGDTCFPVRGKSCSSRAMPFLAQKFTTYHDFALADVTEIYTPETLDDARRFQVTHLESMMFLNDGHGVFSASPLPRLAQISPGFGVVIQDFDGDGNNDLGIAQNFMNPQPETGQLDGGMGLILAGNGHGQFTPLGPLESGVSVAGQGMALTIADINGDRAPDLVMSVNAEPMRGWTSNTAAGMNWINIELKGEPGNPAGVGSRVSITTRSGLVRAFEIQAGSGYLSQSVPTIFTASPPSDPAVELHIRWPDGLVQSQPVSDGAQVLQVERHQAVSR